MFFSFLWTNHMVQVHQLRSGALTIAPAILRNVQRFVVCLTATFTPLVPVIKVISRDFWCTYLINSFHFEWSLVNQCKVDSFSISARDDHSPHSVQLQGAPPTTSPFGCPFCRLTTPMRVGSYRCWSYDFRWWLTPSGKPLIRAMNTKCTKWTNSHMSLTSYQPWLQHVLNDINHQPWAIGAACRAPVTDHTNGWWWLLSTPIKPTSITVIHCSTFYLYPQHSHGEVTPFCQRYTTGDWLSQ